MIGRYSVTVPILKLSTEKLEKYSEIHKGRSDPIIPGYILMLQVKQ